MASLPPAKTSPRASGDVRIPLQERPGDGRVPTDEVEKLYRDPDIKNIKVGESAVSSLGSK